MRERFTDWLVDAPAWLKGIVGVLFIAAGVASIALFGRIGVMEGGKIGGFLIGIGVVLVLLWANDVN